MKTYPTNTCNCTINETDHRITILGLGVSMGGIIIILLVIILVLVIEYCKQKQIIKGN